MAASCPKDSAGVLSPETQMPPLFSLEQCNEARHLLRAILREATYLPDEQARIYIATHATARFRVYTPGHKPHQVLLQRRHAQLDNARKALSELRRANHGELKPLLKVLHLTYARIGKRRHEILASLKQKAPSDAELDAEALSQLTPQHIALLDSQRQASPPTTVRPQLRSRHPNIPELNAWERPMPKKRVANMTRAWYANVLERTIVPLPVGEWEALRKLALGETTFVGPVPRRAMVAQTSDLPSPLEVALGLAPLNSPELVLRNSSNPIHGRKLTARSMRRCWATVFAQCPVMTWEPTSEKWLVQWGCDVLKREQIKHATELT